MHCAAPHVARGEVVPDVEHVRDGQHHREEEAQHLRRGDGSNQANERMPQARLDGTARAARPSPRSVSAPRCLQITSPRRLRCAQNARSFCRASVLAAALGPSASDASSRSSDSSAAAIANLERSRCATITRQCSGHGAGSQEEASGAGAAAGGMPLAMSSCERTLASACCNVRDAR